MAVFWKAMAGGLLLTLSLAVLGWGAEGHGQGKREVSGGATVYLGQDRDIWRPLIHTTVNLSEIRSIKSSFQLRTFDPEGAIFYGDTKNGEDWFVLSLKDGIPLMQINREGVLVSVAGGPKLNDGKWHTVEVSNHDNFVILEVDGSNRLVVGMQSKQVIDNILGDLRLAVGGILIDKEKLIVPFEPQMDGCVREGSWLNLSLPWETEAEELWPCYQNIQPGIFFPGTGFAIFNTSGFPIDDGVTIELRDDFTKLNGTIISIKAPGQELIFSLVANNNTKEVTLTIGEEQIILRNTWKRPVLTFKPKSVIVQYEPDEFSNAQSSFHRSQPSYLSTWRNGLLAFGSLLGEGEGEGEDIVGSQFLTGCLEYIRVQGRDLDLDLAFKHMSVSSHSCPA